MNTRIESGRNHATSKKLSIYKKTPCVLFGTALVLFLSAGNADTHNNPATVASNREKTMTNEAAANQAIAIATAFIVEQGRAGTWYGEEEAQRAGADFAKAHGLSEQHGQAFAFVLDMAIKKDTYRLARAYNTDERAADYVNGVIHKALGH